MNKEKRIITVLMILTVVFTIMGGTFAYWSWRTTDAEKTNITFTITSDFSCSADGGGNINEGDANIIPTYLEDAYKDNFIKREIKVTPTINTAGKSIYMDLWLDIKELGVGLSESENFMYLFTTVSTLSDLTDDTVIEEGNFYGKVSGDKIKLLDLEEYSTTTTETYYLYIWLSSDQITSETMNQKFKLSLNGSCYDNINGEEGIQLLTGKANPSTLSYADATEEQAGEMWEFSHEATAQVGATTDYRYIGNVPNNYITFNNEMWRIIGVFDGKIKIIKDEPISELPWDYKSGVGSATISTSTQQSRISSTPDGGSNDWSDSQLMYMLNNNSYKLKTGYRLDNNLIYDNNNKLIYQLGCNPSFIDSDSTSYDCVNNSWKLNDKALSQVSETTYYLGNDFSLLSDLDISSLTSEEFYTFERGTDVYKERPINWTGLVGLVYPSDYAYTFVSGSSRPKKSIAKGSAGPSLYSWMIKSYEEWTITSVYDETDDYVVLITSNGIYADSPSYELGVRPVVYLKSDVKLARNGTKGSPYIIAN